MLAPKDEEWNSLQSAVNLQTSRNFVIKKELHFNTLYSILKWKGLNLKLTKHSIFLLTLLPPEHLEHHVDPLLHHWGEVEQLPSSEFLIFDNLTLTLLEFFNTDIITRTGLKLTDFNSYDLELGLELMKMLKLDERSLETATMTWHMTS